MTSTLATAGRLRLLMLTAALTVGSAGAGAAQPFTGDLVFDSRDAGLELGSVALSGLAVSASGRLAIVDSHSASLWLVDLMSGQTTSWGRRGEGPGEFQMPGPVAISSAGRVAVFDAPLQRLSILQPGGAVETTAWSPLDHGVPTDLVFVEEELFLLVAPMTIRIPGMSGDGPSEVGIWHLGPNGRRDLVQEIPGVAFVVDLEASDVGLPPGPPVFAPQVYIAEGPAGSLLYSRSDQYTVKARSPSGGSSVVVSRRLDALPVTADVRLTAKARARATFDNADSRSPIARISRDRVDALIEGMQFADRLPLTGLVFGGVGGSIWVQRSWGLVDEVSTTPPAANVQPRSWDVHASDGSRRTVTLPEDFVVAAGTPGGFIVGLQNDPDGLGRSIVRVWTTDSR